MQTQRNKTKNKNKEIIRGKLLKRRDMVKEKLKWACEKKRKEGETERDDSIQVNTYQPINT